MTNEAIPISDYPDVLVPLESAGPQTVLDDRHWRALFGELHRLYDAVVELQGIFSEAKMRKLP